MPDPGRPGRDSLPVSYVLPLRWTGDAGYEDDLAELTAYLRELACVVDEVLVVDGSPAALYARHAVAWSPYVRHLRPDPALRFANGKVNGVTTGVLHAGQEAVVIADDDVRYDRDGLARVVALLADADLVRPQNYFANDVARSGGPHSGRSWHLAGELSCHLSRHLSWHAQWDTARSLLNRCWTADYPGTFGLRRSTFVGMGGYDGDVLFENLELIRTVKAYGGMELRPRDLYVARRPPEVHRFWDQRRRQAYDDFAQPGRLLAGLAVLPALGYAAARRRGDALAAAAAGLVLMAEVGRRRAGGRAVFPATAPLLAPLWVLERGVCDWLALHARLRHGGVSYAGRRLRVAAHPMRQLRRRVPRRPAGRPGPGPSRAARELLVHRGPEPDQLVRAVTERLGAGGTAPAQRDGGPDGLDLAAVRGGDAEGTADQQRAVQVGRDGHVRAAAGVTLDARRAALLHRASLPGVGGEKP